jgi:O-antigen/teichoic acid export membrane protein
MDVARRMIPGRKLFLHRSMVVALIRAVGLLAVFILQMLLARLIGNSEEFGKYAWGQTLLFAAGSLATIGLHIAIGRFIAALNVYGDEQSIGAVITRAHSLLFRSSVGLVVLSLCLAFAGMFSALSSFYFGLSAIALLFASGVSVLLLYQNMARARHWLVLAFLPMYVLRPVVTAILAIAVWWISGRSLSGSVALIVMGVSIIIVDIWQVAIYHRRQRQILPISSNVTANIREYNSDQLMGTALPIFLSRIAGMVIAYSNILLLGLLAGPAQAGAYFAAERLAQLSAVAPEVMSSVSQQDMAAAQAINDRRGLMKVTRRATLGGFWPTCLIGFALIGLSDRLLGLFGDDFFEAGPAMIILVLANMLKGTLGPNTDLLMMTGNQEQITRVMVVAAIVHIALLFALVPLFAATGAAMTSAFSLLFLEYWLSRLVVRELSINSTIFARRN